MSGVSGAAPYTRSTDDVLAELAVSLESGLSRNEVRRRLRAHGPNRLPKARTKSAWTILVSQFKSLIVLFLAAAAGVSLLAGDLLEAAAVGAVILLNGLIGFVSELQAVRSMEALRKLGSVPATVRRDGATRRVSAERLVPGDIVLIDGGDVVTADLRILDASKLEADESALTGESVPVGKRTEVLPADTVLPERSNMLYKGTSITRGAGAAVVVGTGMATELGAISALVDQSLDTAETPIEQRLNRLGARLIWLTLGITLFVAVTGLLAGRDPFVVIKTAIALAVAAIPEGLPIVATLALARGMWRMSNRNALMKRLAAVETLGATDIIFTDKTGTLTEGQMAVRRVAAAGVEVRVTGGPFDPEGAFERDGEALEPAAEPVLMALLEASVLCTDASWDESLGPSGAVGDPVEVALLVAGRKAGLDRRALLVDLPELREEAFDPDVKMMATFHRSGGGVRVAVKGAPETVLARSTRIRVGDADRALAAAEREEWLRRNEALAEDGLRVLAVAENTVPDERAAPYEDLCFLGFVGLVDPPRADVRESIAQCLRAGIRVVMLTGDQEPTARYVAREVGLHEGEEFPVVEGHELRPPEELSDAAESRLLATSTFARVTPKQKLDLVQLAQRHEHIVAMTGDGVNDAPALRQADIGIAMGKRGTQVAREASDMILQDDAFPTIVAAVEQGRVIYENIRTFIRYLISCNVSEILVVFLASILNAPLPLLPMQILFLNLVTDVFPALALGLGEGNRMVMDQPPRNPNEPLLTRGHWTEIVSYGLLIAAAVLGALALAILHCGMSESRAVTVSFLTVALAQLWHVLNMRAPATGIVDNAIVNNAYVWGAVALCLILVTAAVYLPGLALILSTEDPGLEGWSLALAMSLVPLAGGQLWLVIRARREPRSTS